MEGSVARRAVRLWRVVYLGQLRDDETELMVTQQLPQRQSLTGTMHQLLDTLQGDLLIGLRFSCGEGRGGERSGGGAGGE